jgi:hypothetical protein
VDRVVGAGYGRGFKSLRSRLFSPATPLSWPSQDSPKLALNVVRVFRTYREERHQVVGRVGDQVVFVVYTLRGTEPVNENETVGIGI